MILKLPQGLLRATRLVRRGKLMEATDAIQRALRPGSAGRTAPRPSARDTDAIEGFCSVVEDAPPRTGGQFITRSYTNAAGSRRYKAFIPTIYTGQALPLVLMLHGCKQAPDDFAAATRMNALAEEHGFIVVYPEQTSRANGSNCWNWFESAHQQRALGEPSIIAGITSAVIDAYGVDAQRVYAAGLSAGGAMAAVMATTYPEMFAAIGIHSGLPYAVASDVTSAFAAMRGDSAKPGKRKPKASLHGRRVPTIVFHGDADTTVHPRNGDELVASASEGASAKGTSAKGTVERGQASGRRYTRTSYRDAEGRSLVEQWLVHGAAHAWSGGSEEGSYVDASGPDASREMLRFFLQHKAPRSRTTDG